MSDLDELRKCYNAVVSSYSIQPHDSDLDQLRKLLDESMIDRHRKDEYIKGLEELVTELRQHISRLEQKVGAISSKGKT